MTILLVSNFNEHSTVAISLATDLFGEGLVCLRGNDGDALPADLSLMRPDWLISFLSPWIIPKPVLDASKKAINFHPASSSYPGIGCYNFALYECAKEYGTVCHYMTEKMDSGAVIEERRFPVFAIDTEQTLTRRTMVAMLSLFHDVLCRIARGDTLEPAPVTWARRPITRRQLDRLKEITPDMTEAEVKRRIRATTCPGFPGPWVTIRGEKFYYSVSGDGSS